MITEAELREALGKVFEKARKPDVSHSRTDEFIWYGPAGKEGDNATHIDVGGNSVEYSDFHNVIGLIDDADPNNPFLETRVELPYSELIQDLADEGLLGEETEDSSKDDLYDDALEVFLKLSPEEIARWTFLEAGLAMQNEGPDAERFTNELPE